MTNEYNVEFTTSIRVLPDCFITEEDYFDYYQNGCDPTFENYNSAMPKNKKYSQDDEVVEDFPF